MTTQKPIQALYRDLLTAHRRQLIHVARGSRFDFIYDSPIHWLEISFADAVAIESRDRLAGHIRKTYNVQIWWRNQDTLIVQKALT